MSYFGKAGFALTSISVFDTDDLVEGSNNLYFTNERVDDRVSQLIVDGKGIIKNYDDAGNLLSLAIDFSEFSTDDITEGAVNTYLTSKTTDDLNEGSTNLYFTDERAQDAITVDSTLSKTGGQISLPTTGVTANTYGDLSTIPVITVDAQGRITAVTLQTVDAATLDGYDSADFARLAAVSNTFTGTITHGGLVPSAGTAIDQVSSFTKTLTLTTDWQDVGIKSTDLATGSYIVQVFANDVGAGGTNNNEYYSGVMSWFAGDTNSSAELPTDEIPLHRAGASGDGGIYLRTYRTQSADADDLKLQIYSNTDNASASNYVFKFRRMI